MARSCVVALRIQREHFDYIVVKTVVELALKTPRELRVFNFARPQKKNVAMNFHSLWLEKYFDFNAFGSGSRAEIKKRMFVPRDFRSHFFHVTTHDIARRSFLAPSHLRRRASMSSRTSRKNINTRTGSSPAIAGSGMDQ